MGEAYRGLTIMFKADGTSVLSTLKTMKRAASNVESELRNIKRALRFDGASTRAAQAQMKLLAERAGLARGELATMQREYRKLGKVEIGGVQMKELSARTKDASTQASLMNARFVKARDALAALHNEATGAWFACKQLANVPNPFKKGWSQMSTKDLQWMIAYMEQAGAITKEESRRMQVAVKGLRKEYAFAEKELEKFNKVAQFQSFGNKIIEQAAKAKAAVKELNATTKAFKATGFEESLKGSRVEIERLEAQAKQLKTAMHLDPSSFTAAMAHSDVLKAKINALEGESKTLNAQLRSLGRLPGVRKAAADFEKLEQSMRDSHARLEAVGADFAEAKAKAAVYSEELDEIRVKLKTANAEEIVGLGEQYRSKNAQLREQRALVDSLGTSYKNAAKDVQVYNRAVQYNETQSAIAANAASRRSLESQITKPKKQPLISSSAFTSMGMQMYSTLYPAAMMAGMHISQSAREVDSAYRDMRKTVQGSEEDFVALRQKAIEFGDTHITSADEILEIEAMGGQLGITVDNLEQFGKVVSDLSIASDEAFETNDIALWLGKMANIMHLNVEEYDNFADSLVRLGNSEPALESDIAAITARFAGMATLVGSTPDEILAIATAATATGQKAEAAGGSLQRTFGRIEGAVAGVSQGLKDEAASGEEAEEALEALEASQGKLQGFADVAGMTAEQFANLWETDATSAFQKFVNGLKAIGDAGGSVDKTLQDLGITGVRDRQLLEGLTNTTQVLADSLEMSKNAYSGIGDAYGQAGDAAREAANKSQGFSGTLGKLENTIQHLSVSAGEALLPLLNNLLGLVGALTSGFDSLSQPMQQMITGTIALGAVSGPTLTGLGAMMNMRDSARTSLEKYRSAEQTLARVEGSAFLQRTKSGKAFLAESANVKECSRQVEKHTAAQEKYAGQVARLNKMQQKYKNDTQKLARIKQAQVAVEDKHSRATAEAAAAQKSYNNAIVAQGDAAKKLSKTSMLTGALKGIGSLAKGIGGFAVFSAAMVGLDMLTQKIAEDIQKMENFKKSTEGLRQSAETIRSVSEASKGGFDSMGRSLESTTYQYGDYTKKAEAAATRGADLADSINSTLDGAMSSSIQAQLFAEKIEQLAGKCGGSSVKVLELKDAVEQFNNLTGSNLSVVDDFTGRINASRQEIEKMTEAFEKMTMAEAFSAIVKQDAEHLAQLETDISRTEDGMKNAREILEKEGLSYEEMYNKLSPEDGSLMDVGYWNSLSQVQKDAYEQLFDGERALVEMYSQRRAAKETLDAAFMAKGNADQEAIIAQQNADAEERAAKAASTYRDALKEAGEEKGAFKRIAEQAGYGKDQLNEFSAALHESGINAEMLGSIGTETFSRLYSEAVNSGKGMDEVVLAFNALHDYGLEPVQLSVTDDGTIAKVGDEIINFSNNTIKTIDGKKYRFEITSEGLKIVGAEARHLQDQLDKLGTPHVVDIDANASPALQKINEVKGALPPTLQTSVSVMTDMASSALAGLRNLMGDTSATASVSADTSNADSAIASTREKAEELAAENPTVNILGNNLNAMSALNAISSYTLPPKIQYVIVKKIGSMATDGQASGGINMTPIYRVPAFASGAAMNGIVTRPMMTNQGLIGEDGNEAVLRMGRRSAIVPLSNRRFVRPFARAVASEMPNAMTQPTVNKYYSIGNVSLSQGSSAARALEALYEALRLEEAS